MRSLLLIALAVLASCDSRLSVEDEARAALRPVLKDAESARFIELRKDSLGRICGQVNAKNSWGAYSGFNHFYVWRELVHVDDDDDGLAMAKDICKK